MCRKTKWIHLFWLHVIFGKASHMFILFLAFNALHFTRKEEWIWSNSLHNGFLQTDQRHKGASLLKRFLHPSFCRFWWYHWEMDFFLFFECHKRRWLLSSLIITSRQELVFLCKIAAEKYQVMTIHWAKFTLVTKCRVIRFSKKWLCEINPSRSTLGRSRGKWSQWDNGD